MGAVGAAFLLENKNKLVALDGKTRQPFTLIAKEEVSHDVRRFRFALPTPGMPTLTRMDIILKSTSIPTNMKALICFVCRFC